VKRLPDHSWVPRLPPATTDSSTYPMAPDFERNKRGLAKVTRGYEEELILKKKEGARLLHANRG
jgi:hypothetical protein